MRDINGGDFCSGFTWATGKRVSANCLVSVAWVCGPWWTLSWWPFDTLVLQTGRSTSSCHFQGLLPPLFTATRLDFFDDVVAPPEDVVAAAAIRGDVRNTGDDCVLPPRDPVHTKEDQRHSLKIIVISSPQTKYIHSEDVYLTDLKKTLLTYLFCVPPW